MNTTTALPQVYGSRGYMNYLKTVKAIEGRLQTPEATDTLSKAYVTLQTMNIALFGLPETDSLYISVNELVELLTEQESRWIRSVVCQSHPLLNQDPFTAVDPYQKIN